MREALAEILTRSPEETEALARRLGAAAEKGLALCLAGDLGAGKTLFAQGFARGLGVAEEVTSPTFNLMNLYRGRLPLVHFDLYRLEREEELETIGFYEYADAAEGVVLIEWADKFPDAMPEDRVSLAIERGAAENERRLSFSAADDRSSLWKELRKA